MTGTREIPNQIINGTALSERECFVWLVNNLGEARDAARGIAHSRKDMRWLAVAGALDELKEKARLLMNKPKGLVLLAR